MKKLLINLKALSTTIPAILVIIGVIGYIISSWGSIEWEYVIEGLIMAGGLFLSPDAVSKEQRKAFMQKLKNAKNTTKILLLLIVGFSCYNVDAQNTTTSKTVRTAELRGLYTGTKLDGTPNDSSLNIIYTDYDPLISPKSIIYVNDTTLRDWVGANGGGGGGSSDSSWTSIKVDSISPFSGSSILVDGGSITFDMSSAIYLDQNTLITAGKYISGTATANQSRITFNSNLLIASNGAEVTFNDEITPSTNGGQSIGTSALQWDDLFLSGEIQNNVGNVTIADNLEFSSSGTAFIPSSPTATTTGALRYDNAGSGLFEVYDGGWNTIGGGGTPGGSSGQLQYNNAGSFGGTSGFSFDGTNLIGTAGYFQQDDIRIDGDIISNQGSSNDIVLDDRIRWTDDTNTYLDGNPNEINMSINNIADINFNLLGIEYIGTGASIDFKIENSSTGGDMNLITTTGNIALENFVFDSDQTVGAGQDGYVMTYDNSTGLVSLEENLPSSNYQLLTATTTCATCVFSEANIWFTQVDQQCNVQVTLSVTSNVSPVSAQFRITNIPKYAINDPVGAKRFTGSASFVDSGVYEPVESVMSSSAGFAFFNLVGTSNTLNNTDLASGDILQYSMTYPCSP